MFEERNGKEKKNSRRERMKDIVQKTWRRETDRDQMVRITSKTDPLFHTMDNPGQIPETSMYSRSLPDTQHVLFLTHTDFLRNAYREGLEKKRMENEH